MKTKIIFTSLLTVAFNIYTSENLFNERTQLIPRSTDQRPISPDLTTQSFLSRSTSPSSNDNDFVAIPILNNHPDTNPLDDSRTTLTHREKAIYFLVSLSFVGIPSIIVTILHFT